MPDLQLVMTWYLAVGSEVPPLALVVASRRLLQRRCGRQQMCLWRRSFVLVGPPLARPPPKELVLGAVLGVDMVIGVGGAQAHVAGACIVLAPEGMLARRLKERVRSDLGTTLMRALSI